MSTWILDRLFSYREAPSFAFNSTVNWMHALALLVDGSEFSDSELKKHFSKVMRRKLNIEADTLVFENIIMALHNLVALKSIHDLASHKYDTIRSAIIAWYYCIYFSSSALIAGASGASSETHAGTSKILHSNLIQPKLLVSPFSLHLNTLVKNDVVKEISSLRGSNTFNVNKGIPTSKEEAWGAVISYLSGTAEHEAEKIENNVKNNRDYKALGVSDFRTKAARDLRDKALEKGCLNFLVQCFRYRGKANYRDSLFLSYGANHSNRVDQLTKDLTKVAEKYLRMSVHYLALRVEKGTWSDFVNDYEENSTLSWGIDILKI